ncbi:MAG: alpha-L-fucosidase [Candidatus Aminicenantes bacterium]|nr:alpha-L-fucosidase [Candidatus Aminicenantes bacterium]
MRKIIKKNQKPIGFSVIFLLGILMNLTTHAEQFKPTWESLDKRPIPQWFSDAKFGIFIHWGVYSVPAWRKVTQGRYASYAEWYYARVMEDEKNGGAEFHRENYGPDFEYRDFAPLFKAELFDPDYWAELFARSGAKYVVLTSKHHDGYCLWPTKSPYKKDWNSMAVGPKRDLVGELTRAVRKKGLRMGLYYSIIEWESTPTHRTDTGYFINKKYVEKYKIPGDKYVSAHLIPQLKELVNNYQPALIFSDGGEWDRTAGQWKVKDFLAWLYNHAPNKDEVVVNDRWGSDTPGKHGDYFSSEYEDSDVVGVGHPWEESRGVGGSYGFNRDENLDDYSTSAELVHELIDIVGRGGNLLLNVGPTADGRIPVIMQQRLVDIGRWLEINGEAIYGTRPWKKKARHKANKQKGIYYTLKSNHLYIICTTWPEKPVIIDGIKPTSATTVSMLGLKQPVKWQVKEGKLVIHPPLITPAQVPCHYAYVFKISELK